MSTTFTDHTDHLLDTVKQVQGEIGMRFDAEGDHDGLEDLVDALNSAWGQLAKHLIDALPEVSA